MYHSVCGIGIIKDPLLLTGTASGMASDSFRGRVKSTEWINECLTTPQVGLYVGMHVCRHLSMYICRYVCNDTPAPNENRLLGVRQMVN